MNEHLKLENSPNDGRFWSEWKEAMFIRDLCSKKDEIRNPAMDRLNRFCESASKQMDVLHDNFDDDINRIQEANTSSAFPFLLGTSLYRVLESAYGGLDPVWQNIVRERSVPNFKTQERIRVSAFGSLDTLAENEEYKESGRTDRKATYKVAKHGKIFSLTMEAEQNDDLQGLADQAEALGQAAARGIYSDVISVLTANAATTYDEVTLMHASSHGANLSSSDLSEAVIASAIATMKKQKGMANEQLNIMPEWILYPPELNAVAMRAIKSQILIATGLASTSAETLKGHLNAVPMLATLKPLDTQGIPFITTATDWFILANPASAPVIEVGYLQGVKTPVVFREQANSGVQFDRDVSRWKVRFVYGTCAVDHVGIVGRT